jgi:phage shock protein A
MTDTELAALAAAFKSVIEDQGIALRAQIADLRADLDAERQKNAAHRLFESEARQRMAKTLADAIGDAVAPSLQQLRQRTAELERRVPAGASS